jgi:hypothetical protein
LPPKIRPLTGPTLYLQMQRFGETESAYKEALAIERDLAA